MEPANEAELAQWARDAEVVAEIGRAFRGQEDTAVRVQLPRVLAELAVATSEQGDEVSAHRAFESTAAEITRRRAEVLATIGRAIATGGAWDGDTVCFELHPQVFASIEAAARAEAPGRRMPHDCEQMRSCVEDTTVAIVYDPQFREYAIERPHYGSVQTITACPFCGERLPLSMREAWFDALEGLGLEGWVDETPPPYRDDSWWWDRHVAEGDE